MNILHDISLKQYNTFGIDSVAKHMVALRCSTDYDDFADYISQNMQMLDTLFVLGGGSNVVFSGDYNGIIVHPADPIDGGIKLLSRDEDICMVEARAGVVWDDFVSFCIRNGWHGLENLAGIPGTVGASPVQNIGAYGKEAKDVIDRVHVYDLQQNSQRWLENKECHFGYRHSVFKEFGITRYLVDRVVFRLSSHFVPDLSYKGLEEAWNSIDEHEREFVDDATLMAMTVRKVRKSKLPDTAVIGSAGSFFKNPVVDGEIYRRIKERYPNVVAFPAGDDKYKISAGWMIEQCGWKGRNMGEVGVYEKQALVLVNRGNCKGHDVDALSEAIINDVNTSFGIKLYPEVIII